MPRGDAQRVWFPEMLAELKARWTRETPWAELADFCARMTEMRRQIREDRGIRPPKTQCSKCGKVSRSDISGVSIRSALFALRNNGVVTDDEFKELDKSWMKHRKKNGLDPYGRDAAPESAAAGKPRAGQ